MKERWTLSVIKPRYVLLPEKAKHSDERKKNFCRLFTKFGYKPIRNEKIVKFLVFDEKKFEVFKQKKYLGHGNILNW